MAVTHQDQPPEGQINRSGQPPIASTTTPSTENVNVGSKRQRRPSVRLNDIGDKPAKSSVKPSKTRPLVNLGSLEEDQEGGEERDSEDDLAIVRWKNKGFKNPKRVRTNWVLNNVKNLDGESGFDRDFELEEENPDGDSLVNGGDDDERGLKFGVGQDSRGRMRDDGVKLDDNNAGQSSRGGCRGRNDGVRVWLTGLGLARYLPVFKIHEVDEEVLPLLTLEDLKDMGISAVGSRRKMFCAIQKLSQVFS